MFVQKLNPEFIFVQQFFVCDPPENMCVTLPHQSHLQLTHMERH